MAEIIGAGLELGVGVGGTVAGTVAKVGFSGATAVGEVGLQVVGGVAKGAGSVVGSVLSTMGSAITGSGSSVAGVVADSAKEAGSLAKSVGGSAGRVFQAWSPALELAGDVASDVAGDVAGDVIGDVVGDQLENLEEMFEGDGGEDECMVSSAGDSGGYVMGPGRPFSGIVFLELIAARNLMAADVTGTSDPYIKIRAGKTVKEKTKVVKKTLNPVWNEKFEFQVKDQSTVLLKIRDWDRLTHDDDIGKIQLDISHFPRGVMVEKWVPVFAKGEVHMKVSLLPPLQGKLTVNILEARNLIAADRGGTSDPYCELALRSEKYVTKKIMKTLAPQWHETHTFKVKGQDAISINVYDWDRVGKNDHLGKAEFSAGQWGVGECDCWIPLNTKGEVHLSSLFTADPGTFDPMARKRAIEQKRAKKMQQKSVLAQRDAQRRMEMQQRIAAMSVTGGSHPSSPYCAAPGSPYGPGSPYQGSPGVYGMPSPGSTVQYGAPGAPPPGQYGSPRGAPQAGQYGAPQAGQYGAPQAGQYGAPQSGQYGSPLGAPQPGAYGNAPPGGGYGAPPQGSMSQWGGSPSAPPGAGYGGTPPYGGAAPCAPTGGSPSAPSPGAGYGGTPPYGGAAPSAPTGGSFSMQPTGGSIAPPVHPGPPPQPPQPPAGFQMPPGSAPAGPPVQPFQGGSGSFQMPPSAPNF